MPPGWLLSPHPLGSTLPPCSVEGAAFEVVPEEPVDVVLGEPVGAAERGPDGQLDVAPREGMLWWLGPWLWPAVDAPQATPGVVPATTAIPAVIAAARRLTQSRTLAIHYPQAHR